MSRIGKSPVPIPSGVEVTINNNQITAKGPKGVQTLVLINGIKVEKEDSFLLVILDDPKLSSAFHGLYRALIQNLLIGVHKGFEKKLLLIGVGYRAAVNGTKLDLQLGYSHPTQLDIPPGIEVKVEKGTEITLSSSDKQSVGQFAAEVRSIRKVEPYKGKGVRYAGEYVRKKAGKAAKGK